MSVRADILDEAKRIVSQIRAQTYGTVENSFGRIAAYWSAHLDRPVSSTDVAAMMALLKLARLAGNPGHRDSWLDLAGYAACGGEAAEALGGPSERQPVPGIYRTTGESPDGTQRREDGLCANRGDEALRARLGRARDHRPRERAAEREQVMARTKREKIEAARRRSGKRALVDQWQRAEQPPEPHDDPRGVVLDARCRQLGRPTRDSVMAEPWGDPAGQAILIGTGDQEEAARLWALFKAADGADDAYARRFVGIRRFPASGQPEAAPERFETRPDDRPDHRTAEQRDRDAVNDWMRWQGLLGRLGRDQHTAIVDAMRHRARLTHAGRLTATGAMFVAGMRALDREAQR